MNFSVNLGHLHPATAIRMDTLEALCQNILFFKPPRHIILRYVSITEGVSILLILQQGIRSTLG